MGRCFSTSPLATGTAWAILAALCAAQTTTRVSMDTRGEEANQFSTQAVISADGRYVAFQSLAWNLVPADTNGVPDVFVHDRHSGRTTRVSVNSLGVQGNGSCFGPPAISADGRFVSFWSLADNLVPADTNDAFDVFVHDRQTGQTERVSEDSAGSQANASSYSPAISSDGRFVAFESFATNLVLGDANATYDIFLHDRQLALTTRLSLSSAGVEGDQRSERAAISADGRYVAFRSEAGNLVAGDANGLMDVFVRDCLTATTRRVSVSSSGAEGNGVSRNPVLSADGHYLCFESRASNLAPGDLNSAFDVFLHDCWTAETSLVSLNSFGAQGSTDSFAPAISADGRSIAFHSSAPNFVWGDSNGVSDVFVHDRQTGKTARCSESSAGVQANALSLAPSISADGRLVAFESEASALVNGDTNGKRDLFVHDRARAPALASFGVCPGDVSLLVSGATPFERVGILRGRLGSVVSSQPPCPGLQLDLKPTAMAAMLRANTSGIVAIALSLPASVCGVRLQAVDLVRCRTTAVVLL